MRPRALAREHREERAERQHAAATASGASRADEGGQQGRRASAGRPPGRPRRTPASSSRTPIPSPNRSRTAGVDEVAGDLRRARRGPATAAAAASPVGHARRSRGSAAGPTLNQPSATRREAAESAPRRRAADPGKLREHVSAVAMISGHLRRRKEQEHGDEHELDGPRPALSDVELDLVQDKVEAAEPRGGRHRQGPGRHRHREDDGHGERTTVQRRRRSAARGVPQARIASSGPDDPMAVGSGPIPPLSASGGAA